jgi:hypothetical protein
MKITTDKVVLKVYISLVIQNTTVCLTLKLQNSYINLQLLSLPVTSAARVGGTAECAALI